MDNMELRRKLHDLGDEIAGDIHHGECFYEEKMLKDFIDNLDKLKELSKLYYESNRKELEEDE